MNDAPLEPGTIKYLARIHARSPCPVCGDELGERGRAVVWIELVRAPNFLAAMTAPKLRLELPVHPHCAGRVKSLTDRGEFGTAVGTSGAVEIIAAD